MSTRQERYAALTLIASTGRRTVEEVNAVGSQAVTEALIDRGLIHRDKTWTGCLVLTDLGSQRADMMLGYPLPADTASYTLEGRIYVDDAEVGTFDADGGTWEDEVRDVLAKRGYATIGEWSTGADYTSTIAVKDA